MIRLKFGKLVVVLSAMALATVTYAADLNWKAFGALNDGGAAADWYTGGQAYLIYVTDPGNFNVKDNLTITGGTVVDSAIVEGGVASSVIDGNSINPDLAAGDKFAVLFTTDGLSGNTMPTSGYYGVNSDGGSFFSITWNKDVGGGFTDGGSHFAMVILPVNSPEPTSGVLILLGMAGLALKRKRI